jgi:hypothetical protein
VGVLVVHLGEVGTFDAEIVTLLTRMVENVSFALDNLYRELSAGRENARRCGLKRTFGRGDVG